MFPSKYFHFWNSIAFFLIVFSNAEPSPSVGETVETNACLLGGAPMYCTCDNSAPNQAHAVSCVFVSRTEPGDPAWLGFESQKDIRELVLSCMLDARLTYINSGVLNQLPKMTVLAMREFNTEILWPYSIANMTSLRNVTMENCEIQTLESYSISFLPNLIKLSLSDNMISRIPVNALYRLPKLQQLHLERNEIVALDDLVFLGMPLMEELSLWDNLIDHITPKTFVGLTSLLRLYMYSNRLYRLDDGVFSGAPQLRELDLRNNLIETVSPHAFDGLNYLTSLLITNNKIRTLPKHVFKGAPNLQVIDLTRNQLVTFQQGLLRPLKHSHNEQFIIFVKENPLVCSCDLLWINSYVKNVRSFLFKKELSHLKCQLENSTQKIVKTSPIDLSCPEVSIRHRSTQIPDKNKWKQQQEQQSSTVTSEVTSVPTKLHEEIPEPGSHPLPPVLQGAPPKPSVTDDGERKNELEESNLTDEPSLAEPKREENGSGGGASNLKINVYVGLQCLVTINAFGRIFHA